MTQTARLISSSFFVFSSWTLIGRRGCSSRTPSPLTPLVDSFRHLGFDEDAVLIRRQLLLHPKNRCIQSSSECNFHTQVVFSWFRQQEVARDGRGWAWVAEANESGEQQVRRSRFRYGTKDTANTLSNPDLDSRQDMKENSSERKGCQMTPHGT